MNNLNKQTSLVFVRRKSDGKVFRDIVNGMCNVHNIYDDDGTRIICDYDYNIANMEGFEFLRPSDMHELGLNTKLKPDDIMIDDAVFDRIKPVTQDKR